MTNQDKGKFAECMAGLQEVFISKPISEEKIEIYYRIFQDWSIDKFQKACENVIKLKKISTFPLPAEIMQVADGDKALMAWLDSQQAVGEAGSWQSVVFGDKTIHSIIEALGGWVKFCLTKTDELKWIQKDFERLYPLMSKKQAHPLKCIGQHDINNQSKGFKGIDNTLYIGAEKPKQIEK